MCFKGILLKYFEGRCMLRCVRLFVNTHLSLCSFQVRVCCAASPWCCWWRCCGCRLCCCSCCTSTQQGGTVAEKRGVSVSNRVSSTSEESVSTVNGWSTRRSTPAKRHTAYYTEQFHEKQTTILLLVGSDDTMIKEEHRGKLSRKHTVHQLLDKIQFNRIKLIS